MANRVREVPLRERATPYDFVVRMSSLGRTGRVYKGRAYKEALRSYWQAVNTLCFLESSGRLEMILTLNRKPFGGFATDIKDGTAVAVHKPSGSCKEWLTRGWIGHPIEEKFLSLIPGTLGLPRDPD